jgi:hypothetical protein
MTFLEAALEILKRERRPLHFKELTEKATERKLLTFVSHHADSAYRRREKGPG